MLFNKLFKKKNDNHDATESTVPVSVSDEQQVKPTDTAMADIAIPEIDNPDKVIIEETIITRSSQDVERAKKSYAEEWKSRIDSFSNLKSVILTHVVRDYCSAIDFSKVQVVDAQKAYMTRDFIISFTFSGENSFALSNVIPENENVKSLLRGAGVVFPYTGNILIESKIKPDSDGGSSPHLCISVPCEWGMFEICLNDWMENVMNYTLLDCTDAAGNVNPVTLYNYFIKHGIITANAIIHPTAQVQAQIDSCAAAEYYVMILMGIIARSSVTEYNSTVK